MSYDPSLPPQPPKSSGAKPVVIVLIVVGALSCCGLFGVGLVIGLLVPAVQKVREAADRTQTLNRLSQIGIGAHAAHDALKTLPPGNGGPYAGKNGTVLYHLLP